MDGPWYVRIVAMPQRRWWEAWKPSRIEVIRVLHREGQGDLRDLRLRLRDLPADFGPFHDERRVQRLARELNSAGAAVQVVGPPI